MAKATEANSSLSKQLTKLYNINFPTPIEWEDDGTLTSEDELDEIVTSPLKIQKTRVSVKGGKLIKEEEDVKSIQKPIVPPLWSMTDSPVKSDFTRKEAKKTEASNLQVKRLPTSINPSNYKLLSLFINFVGKVPYNLD